jgi:hypothetical protein
MGWREKSLLEAIVDTFWRVCFAGRKKIFAACQGFNGKCFCAYARVRNDKVPACSTSNFGLNRKSAARKDALKSCAKSLFQNKGCCSVEASNGKVFDQQESS